MFNSINILNENTDNTSYLEECTIESLLENAEIKAPENLVESTYELLALHERNEALIDNITGAHAIKSLYESGEVLLEGTRIDSIIEAAKKYINSIWTKIQEIFKSAAIYFSKLTKSGKSFYKTYEKDINQVLNSKGSALHSKEIEWYNYKFYDGNNGMSKTFKRVASVCSVTSLSKVANITNGFDTFEKAVEWFNANYTLDNNGTSQDNGKANVDEALKALSTEKITEILDVLRGQVIKAVGGTSNSSVTTSEFGKELATVLQGSDTKETVALDVAAQRVVGNYMLESDKIKKVLNDAIKETKKSLDSAIKTLENCRKTANSNTGKQSNDSAINAKLAGLLDKYVTITKGSRSILLQANTKTLEVAKSAEAQAKSILVKVLSYRNAKGLGESANDDTLGFGISYTL